MDNTAYSVLKNAFENRRTAAEALASEGRPLVFMMGDEVPEELIIAAGFTAVRLFGSAGERPNADKYLEMSFGAQWRGYFEAVVGAEYGGLMDYLVLSNSSDLIQRLYYYLMDLGRIEPQRRLPHMHYVDYSLIVKEFSAQQRNIEESRILCERLGQWSGKPITDEALREAISLCNTHRRAVRRIGALRREGKISGSDALIAVCGSFFFEKARAAELLNAIADSMEFAPSHTLIPVYYTGSLQEDTRVYELMEDCGLCVIGDDKLSGDRYGDMDVRTDIDPITAITLRYHKRPPSSERAYVAERVAWIPDAVRGCGAKGVIVFMNHNDESYIWDLPKQKKRLDEMNVPVLTIEDQYYPLRDVDELKRKFVTFATALKEE